VSLLWIPIQPTENNVSYVYVMREIDQRQIIKIFCVQGTHNFKMLARTHVSSGMQSTTIEYYKI